MTKSVNASRRKAVAAPVDAASDANQTLPAQVNFDLHIPLLSRAIFWRPRHLAPSPDLPLLPSLFWLIETVQPARSVQLGLGDGVAYLALCQAIDKLGFEASVTGIEPRENSPALPPAMADQHHLSYRDFSHVIALPPAEAAQRMPASEIDLLVINCPLDGPLIEAISTLWLPRLSPRAVIVVLNPHVNAATPEAMTLLKKDLKQSDSVSFDQGDNALLLVLRGAVQPDRLRRLVSLDHNEPTFLAALQIFRRMGDAFAQEWTVIDQANRARQTEADLEHLQGQLANSHTALEKSRIDATAAVAGERQQAAQLARLQAQSFDSTQALAKYEELKRELAASQAQNKAQSEESQRLAADHRAALESAQDKIRQAESKLDALTAHFSILELDPNSSAAEMSKQHNARKAALEAAEDKARTIEQKLTLAETSWRQTASAQISSLEAQHQARVEDIAALTASHQTEIEQLQDQLKAASEAFAEAQNVRKRHWKALETIRPQLQKEKERVAHLTKALSEQHKLFEAEKRAMMSSTSWKITKPLRGLGNTLRRDKTS